ncbi:hypothetical protein ABG067_007127 [Albugo candida]|uniref:tRNA-binding domain-containing protein n=1 Tax=Albugo candida TaxID=65357 RepID=A0A024GID4_9STRA|nr:unnamed protein product [Albugo candida]|eukprot:CCI46515.1 unnamed protein product [Albugo candida]
MALGQSSLFSNLDVRVGKVVEVKQHPTSEKHYVEKVQVGTEEILEIVSEHQPYFTEEEVLHRMVVVLCNLRTTKIAKHRSRGQILMVGNGKGGMELVEPPQEASVGERIVAKGEDVIEPMTALHLKKYKVWESVGKDIKTNKKHEVLYKGFYPLSTSAGKCKVESLENASIQAA